MTNTQAIGENTHVEPVSTMESAEAAAILLLKQADLMTPIALRAAATLRIVDRIEEGSTRLEEIADATATMRRPLKKLLDHLVALDVLTVDGAIYASTVRGRLLSNKMDHLGVRPMLDLDNVVGRAEVAVLNLLHTLRTGRSAFEARGRTLWEDIDQNGRDSDVVLFIRETPLFDAELVVEGFDWGSATSFLDVGGNTGALAATLLHAHPHLRGTVLDLPCFTGAARTALAARDLSGRCDVVGQSFFEELPSGRDVYILSAILADWEDSDAVRILRRCRDALPGHGVVLIAEVHLAPQHPDPFERTAAALRIEASMGNPDRNTDDLAALAEQAGLAVVWEGPASPVRSLIALRPSDSAGC